MADDQVIDLQVRARAILGEAQKQISAFMKEVDSATEATKKKTISLGDMAKATAAVGAAVTALAAGVGALGARGADIADLRDSFNKMNAAIGNDSTAVLDALRKAFAGTRTDAELLRMSNQALSAGLRANKDEFTLLANAARILSDRTGVDSVQAFKALSTAMATGKTKAAELLVGVIDNVAAETRYAAQLGTTASKLSEAEKATAAAAAVKQRLKEVVEQNGLAQVDFADKVDQSKTKLGNMVDGVSEWVATRPEIGAWSSVITAASASLGALAMSVGPLTAAFKSLATTTGLSGLAGSLTAGTAGLAGIKAAAASAAVPLGALAAAIASVWGAWKIGNIESVKNSIAEWGLSANNVTAHIFRWVAGVERLTPEQAKLAVQSTAAAEAARKQAAAKQEASRASDELSRELERVVAAARQEGDQFRADIAAIEANEAATKKAAKAKEDLAKAYNALVSEARNAAAMAQFELDAMLANAVSSSKTRELQTKANLMWSALITTPVNDAVSTVVQRSGDLHAMLLQAVVPGRDFAQRANQGLSDAFRSAFTGLQETIRTQFGSTVLAAVTGGGDVGRSIGALIGNAITQDLFKANGLGSNFQKQVSGLFGQSGMGKWMGEAISSFLPGIGSLVTSFLGPLASKVAGFFKNMFGGPDQKELEGRSVVAQFKEELAASLSMTQKLEAGTEGWKQQVVAIRDAYLLVGRTEQEALDISARLWKAEKDGPDAVNRVIAEISQALTSGYLPANQQAHAIAVLGWNGVLDVINQGTGALGSAGAAALGFGDSVRTAAETVVGDFGVMTERVDALKEHIGKPITIDVVMRQVNELGDTISSSSGQSVSTDWQLSGKTWEQARAEFLARNPGDEHRFLAAYTDAHRIDEAMVNVPGAAAGGIYSKPTFRVIAEREPEVVGSPNVIARSFMAALQQSGGGQSGDLRALCDEIRRMGGSLADLPRAIERSVRDGVLLAAA